MPGLFGLDPELEFAVSEYDFAKDGGAIGDITLRGSVIPKGAVIRDSFLFVETALTSDGLATIALKSEGAEDILAAEAVANFSASAVLQGVPDWATVADAVVTTDDRSIVMSIATAALKTGKFRVYTSFVIGK